jgi:hypothetical protein
VLAKLMAFKNLEYVSLPLTPPLNKLLVQFI